MTSDLETFFVTVDGLNATKDGLTNGLRNIKSFKTGIGAFDYYENYVRPDVKDESAAKIEKVVWRTEDSNYEPGLDETRSYVLAADDHEGNTRIIFKWKKQVNPFIDCMIEFVGQHSAELYDLDSRIYDDPSKAESKIPRLKEINELLIKSREASLEDLKDDGVDISKMKHDLRRRGWRPVTDGKQDPRYQDALEYEKQRHQDNIDRLGEKIAQLKARSNFRVRSIVTKKIRDFGVDLLRALS